MEGLGVAANVIAVVDISFKLAEWCVQYAHDVKNAQKDIEKLQREVVNFQVAIGQVKSLIEGPGGQALQASRQLGSAIEDARSTLEELERKLQPSTGRKAMSRVGWRALKWPFSSKAVEETIQHLARSRDNISFALNTDHVKITQHVDHTLALDRLPVAAGAAFDSHAEEHNPTCLPDTRVELLDDIARWIDDPDAKPVFWLNGKAGTGKSTISRTVAQLRHSHGDLGASFFFKRGEPDRGSLDLFVPTLASQLAQSVPATAFAIKNTIDTYPAIIGKGVREQFDKLVREPLSKASEAIATLSSLVIVIDALDECEQDKDIKLLISILTNTQILRPRLRVFLTSRPELPIRLGFSKVKGTYKDLILDQIPAQTARHDISVFLADEFRRIRDDFNITVGDERKLPSDWPGQQTLQTLTRMAVPLFIFAATVCRFIDDRNCGSPPMQLQEVLNHRHKNYGSQLGLTYGPVLSSQLIKAPKDKHEQIVRDFKAIVGSIVVLASPLSVAALSQLLDISPEIVDTRLDILHSVLSIPMTCNSPVRLLHLSFRDYLVDPREKEKNEFWVDEKVTHRRLTSNCLRVMRGALRENMCGLSFPGVRRSTVDRLQLARCLAPEVQYACLYWVYHQTAVECEQDDSQQVYRFLSTHFLHWLEAMSLMGRIGESLDILRSLASWLKGGKCARLSNFINDAVRFIKTSLSVIDEAPLQVYSSALVFAPRKSVVRRLFEKQTPSWLSVRPQVKENWDACLSVMEGHSDSVQSVVFSHDSKMVASASLDKTIRIWNIETGECKHVLKGHSNLVKSVVFSHDSNMVASASLDKTIRIWNIETGECKHVLKGHSNLVKSVVFSHDSNMVASASGDKTARIWNIETGECKQVLEGHSDSVKSVVFSHDSNMVASASDDKTIRIWNIETGEYKQVLEGHSNWVNSVVFSHDSKMVASASLDKTIRIWNIETGECKHVLKGHSDSVQSVVISHDSKMVASASLDKTIRIWNIETGECKHVLKGHSKLIYSVVISHDSKMVASASLDKTARIWNIETGECKQVLEGHSDSVKSVVFSHDSKMVASASSDKTARIWNIETGECEHVLKGHSSWVRAVVFSHDSKMVASASFDKTARIWSVETGECKQVLQGHSSWVDSVVFSHNSKMVASASFDKTARIWSVETGEYEQVLKGHYDSVRAVVFSHDSKMVASASFDKTARIWNAETGECKQVLQGHSSWVRAVVFSHDSKMVASASFDKTARIWSVETGECKQVLQGHSSWVDSVVFSHNSKMVASASDSMARIWNAETGMCKEVIPLKSSTEALSFTYDNSALITDDGVISLTVEPMSSAEHATSSNSSAVSALGLRDDTWITMGGKDLLWLPAECRYGKTAISAKTVVIGCLSGRLALLGFSATEIGKL
ncbi:Vegetative incompatibility protein HET-E-1 [Fusarium oxysporum f. sp. raphani]|uniref:Vegetative incompatibility protein HET-E-1 n=1 Tax=Fusarium oxysporum f. sp. raphani TaxID=96318 RepID=A0A8J5U374_FUSOX|nr:Vegetative incompatibility protein HET-E-1 [Fusarium oxysporum f. sp. raphani]